MIGKSILHYKITEKLGEGGMGVVYKAEDAKLKRDVAIKFLPRQIAASEEERARFKIEAQAAAALNHPNIATIFNIEEVDGEMFIVMEYIEGQELRHVITEKSPEFLKLRGLLDIATQIASGLQAAHKKGVTHRDIKSANIMITDEGQVKIMDFGLAKIGDGAQLTKSGMTLGTVTYMSPEQTHGIGVDHRTDIWSFGVVLYEMLTGELPFKGDYEQAVMYSIMNEDPTSIAGIRADVPPELVQVVEKALRKEPSDRYQDMADVLTELKTIKLTLEKEADLWPGVRTRTKKIRKSVAVASGASGPERRQVTVLSCQFVAASAGQEPLDPEDLQELLPAYHELCDKVIARFEGHIAQALGEKISAYFGYPAVHEDDAHRALYAGLAIVEGMRGLNTRLGEEKGLKLSVRLGVHTGLVITGDGKKFGAVVGETPAVANELIHFAELNSLLISETTFQLVKGYFDCRELGERRLQGFPKPVCLYQALHESAARSRFEAGALSGLTALVGREKEVGLLLDHWQQAVDGNGQVVLLNGEAGIGKSRLVHELKKEVADNPQAWLTECQCSIYHESSPLYPIIDFLERVVLRFERTEPVEEKLEKLEGYLLQNGFPLPETVPLFAGLLSIPTGEKYPPLDLPPPQQKQKTLEAILKLVLNLSTQQPLLLVVEDLHWTDPSTLELLDLIVEQAPTTRLFALLTFRPDFQPQWPMHSYLSYMTLNRLHRNETERIVSRVTKDKALPQQVIDHIASKTDGVPLFVEEMTKAVVESDLLAEQEDRYELTGSLTKLAIPTTLRDSLTARLDRQGTAREVAQLASVFGRRFPLEWLEAASPLDEARLSQELGQLVESELLYRKGLPPKVAYFFKHALIQDAAYESLLKSKRQTYHGQIAEIFVTQFVEIAEAQPELLAHHYTEAGLKKPAVDFWQKAGKQAGKRSANVEAVSHLTKGLTVLETLPETTERNQQELALQVAMGNILIFTRGYTSPEVEKTYSRAGELCKMLGETSDLLPVLYGLYAFSVVGAKYHEALEFGETFLNIATREQGKSLVVAHRAVGLPFLQLGEFEQAREHFDQIVALYDNKQHHSLTYLYGQEPGVAGHTYLALALWFLGYPEQGLKQNRESINLAEEASHAYSLAWSLGISAMYYQYLGEWQVTQEHADRTISISEEHGLAFWLQWGTILRGWAVVEQGRVEEGIEQMRKGLAAYQATGAKLVLSYFLTLLAQAHGIARQTDQGLSVVAEGLTHVEKTDEGMWEAELYRVKGELLLQKNEPETEVAAWFRKALDTARSQQARSFELRAAMSLGRLWVKQRKKKQAHKLLKEICGWFTEGFDTADLKEARALLDEWA